MRITTPLTVLLLAFAPVTCGAVLPKAVLVIHSAGGTPQAVENFHQRFGKETFRIVVAGDTSAAAEIPGAHLLFLEHPNTDFMKAAKPVAEAEVKRGMIVLTDQPELLLRGWNMKPPEALNLRMLPYWQAGGAENLTSMLMLFYQASGGAVAMNVPAVIPFPTMGVYHPKAPHLFPNLTEYLAWYRKAMPKQGKLAIVSFFHTSLRAQETKTPDALIEALEQQGLAAAGVFGWPYSTIGNVLQTPADDPIIVNLSFLLGLSRPEDAGALAKTGAHVIGLITTRDSYAEWAKTERGVSAERTASSLSAPERNGVTEPIMVSTQEADPLTGIYKVAPIQERVEMAAKRARRWVSLQQKTNAEKKLAILYFNNPAGKGNLGASYLNLPPSISAVLTKLRENGYNVGGELPTTKELLAQLELVGRNVELWAPGELQRIVDQGGVTLLPVEEYRRWFNVLPKQFRDSINARWGQPEESKLMTLTGRDGRKVFVIPGIRLGNVFLGPQLLRASSEEYTKAQHSATLPPHHAYVASYLYYRHRFGADAMIHMGRHGTLEWLPGKNAGQAGWDTSEVLLGDLPNLNYYIMDGGGEALQARRRSAAVLVSHLTPMLASGGVQDRFKVLQKAFDEWTSLYETSPAVAAQYSEQAMAEARRLHLDTQLLLTDLDASKWMEPLGEFLQEAEEVPIPLSLPTLGQMPTELNQREGLLKLVESSFTVQDLKSIRQQLPVWAGNVFDGKKPEVPETINAALREKLIRTFDLASTWLQNLRVSPARELNSMIDVLNAKFLPSGIVGDPLGVPAALPSGRNLHDTDPATFPTKQAWEVGKKMADLLIGQYSRQHGGAALERTSMVLWAGETGRSQGVMEAEAFYLMGVTPEWNGRGAVDRVKLITDGELGRPRVNVVLTASGLYRDSYADKILLLDRAARMAAAAGDNAVSRQNRQAEVELIAHGMAAEEARYLAGARVFAPAPGSYGTGLSNLVEQSRDKDEASTMADLYINKTNYVYTEKVWGESRPHMLLSHLAGNQVILHSRSSNLYGVADNDDVYQAVGGLDIASKAAGAKPDVMFNNLRAPGKERVDDARHVLATELNSRNWNPKWLKGMKEAGYSGARLMANSVEYLYGWQATAPEAVDPSVWKKTYDVYVADEHKLGIPEFLSKENPFAQQKLVARLIEIDRQGVYKFTKAEQDKMLQTYVSLVSKLGVACSANVCGNQKLQQYVVQMSGEAGPQQISRVELAKFEQQFRQAANSSPSPSSPKATQAQARKKPGDRSWLRNVAFIDLNPKRNFLAKPFGLEWSVWLAFSGLLGCLYPYCRRRTKFWSSVSLISCEKREL